MVQNGHRGYKQRIVMIPEGMGIVVTVYCGEKNHKQICCMLNICVCMFFFPVPDDLLHNINISYFY